MATVNVGSTQLTPPSTDHIPSLESITTGGSAMVSEGQDLLLILHNQEWKSCGAHMLLITIVVFKIDRNIRYIINSMTVKIAALFFIIFNNKTKQLHKFHDSFRCPSMCPDILALIPQHGGYRRCFDKLRWNPSPVCYFL